MHLCFAESGSWHDFMAVDFTSSKGKTDQCHKLQTLMLLSGVRDGS